MADRDNRTTRPATLDELDRGLSEGREISRSLWDSGSLLAHLDIEYVNFDFPGEAYLDPARAFGLQQPVVEATEKMLLKYGIRPLHILSGRGHHFLWQISQSSDAYNELMDVGEWPAACDYVRRQTGGRDSPTMLQQEGFIGLGLVMEMLAHEIKREAASQSRVPIELTAVEVGPGERGREMVSIDISEYGDPLQSRSIRVPFSNYLKPWQQRDMVGVHVTDKLKPITLIPLRRQTVEEALEIRCDAARVGELARHSSVRIPYQETGMAKLTGTYLASPLRIFHDMFYAQRHEPAERWAQTYNCLPREPMPACMLRVLDEPNDLLLRPWAMKLVTRVLLSLGWHPRHIAGLIRSKFEQEHHWGEQWKDYEPGWRADFYVRLFAGLFSVQTDDLTDFNCQSFKEEVCCPFSNCTNNLDWYRQSAMSRRRYGYLAHRPFNRLFLSGEHL